MTNIIDLPRGNPDAASRLVDCVPPITRTFDRERMIQELPDILESALGMILDDLDVIPGRTTSGAIGCRIIAACIARLRD